MFFTSPSLFAPLARLSGEVNPKAPATIPAISYILRGHHFAPFHSRVLESCAVYLVDTRQHEFSLSYFFSFLPLYFWREQAVPIFLFLLLGLNIIYYLDL